MPREVNQHLTLPGICRFEAQRTRHALPKWTQSMIQFQVVAPKLPIRKGFGTKCALSEQARVRLKVEVKMFPA
jgi:hypothetical protein